MLHLANTLRLRRIFRSVLTPRTLALLAIAGSVLCSPEQLRAASCSPLPPINADKDFVGNFYNSCYVMRMASGGGSDHTGDPGAVYDQMYFYVKPAYELVVIGTFPNSRFMSATVYDYHLSSIGFIVDQNIPPLVSTMINPFVAGNTFRANGCGALPYSSR